MHHQIEEFMRLHDVQRMALTETNLAGSTKYVAGDTLFITSSSLESGSREHAGVAFALSKSVRSRLTMVEPRGSRHMVLGLREAAR
eukprot:8829621-Alexandrium_andersonii.AAC.1